MDFDRLPEIIAKPEAVLFDAQEPALLYVFRSVERTDRKGKIVVRVNFDEKQRDRAGNRRLAVTNSIRTGGYVQPEDLRVRRYRVLEGEVERNRRDETPPSMQYNDRLETGPPSTGRAIWVSPITRPTRRRPL